MRRAHGVVVSRLLRMQKALGSNPSGSRDFRSLQTAVPHKRGIEDPQFRDSIVVSISACHADDPGSIPGRGVFIG